MTRHIKRWPLLLSLSCFLIFLTTRNVIQNSSRNADSSPSKNCEKKKNIVFLKTHKVSREASNKFRIFHCIVSSLTHFVTTLPTGGFLMLLVQCGSSSLQNIFLRFGEKNNLNFAIPRRGSHQLYGQSTG